MASRVNSLRMFRSGGRTARPARNSSQTTSSQLILLWSPLLNAPSPRMPPTHSQSIAPVRTWDSIPRSVTAIGWRRAFGPAFVKPPAGQALATELHRPTRHMPSAAKKTVPLCEMSYAGPKGPAPPCRGRIPYNGVRGSRVCIEKPDTPNPLFAFNPAFQRLTRPFPLV